MHDSTVNNRGGETPITDFGSAVVLAPSHVGGSQEVEHRGTAPLIRQQVPHSPLPLPLPRHLLDPCPQLDLLISPPGAVLEGVVARLLHTTVVIRVAPPTVVVRSVVGTLQVHAREGMPRLELVIPRGRPFLRPCWGWPTCPRPRQIRVTVFISKNSHTNSFKLCVNFLLISSASDT